MTRPLRIEFPGALYHVTARGNQRNAIYHSNSDRYCWLDVLALVCERFNFVVHAYCQMTNRYHVLLETMEGNLAQGMRQLNGIYCQRINKRHQREGHVLQGRYHSVLVQKEAHLLELARYLVLNPVRAGFVDTPEEWHWSSYHAMLAPDRAPAWLETEWLLGQFGGVRNQAVCAYREFVSAGIANPSPLQQTRHQILLGDEAFASQNRARKANAPLVAVAKTQRRIAALTLPAYEMNFPDRDEAMARAYASTAFSMAQIGAHFGVSDKTVSRAVRRYECADVRGPERC